MRTITRKMRRELFLAQVKILLLDLVHSKRGTTSSCKRKWGN